MKLGELAERLGCTIEGDGDVEIRGVASVQEAGPDELSFIDGEKFNRFLKTTRAGALIVGPATPSAAVPCIRTDQPRLTFARALAFFDRSYRPAPGIHPTAVLGEGVKLGGDVYLGPHVVVGDGAVIGEQAVIHANCTIYPEVRIGARTVVHASCVLYEHTEIGEDCIVQAGAVLGGEGFGFVPTADGRWHKMPQTGIVRIGDRVEIGANTTIDRPSVGATQIGSGTKIDNLVMIGHGCTIGENCLLVAQVGLAGGVELGRNVLLAGQVGVADHVQIGERTVVTAQSGVHSNVEAGAVVSGRPQTPHSLWLRTIVVMRRLPEIWNSLRELQQKVAALQKRLDSRD